MKIVELENNLIQYTVPAANETSLGQNFFILVAGDKALMINAGYKPQCTLVLADLKFKGIHVTQVIPSHFHPDHVEGIALMNSPKVYGNKHAHETLEMFYAKEDVEVMAPTDLIDNASNLKFGSFNLTFQSAPGHSNCTMVISLNDKYLHIGDLYIKTDDGGEVLPFVKWAHVSAHITSLNQLQTHSNKTFLISHGQCPITHSELTGGISDRTMYLKALLDSNNTISVQNAIKSCVRPFSFLKWRNDVK